MKRNEFHSSLPPEKVFARLDAGAKQVNKSAWNGSAYMQKKRFFFYRNGDCFRLTYTGTMPMNGFIPFSGEVRAEGTGSVITGGFSVLRTWWKLFAVLSGIVFVVALLMGASPGFALFGSVLALLWFPFSMWLIQKAFRGRQKAVLKFIEDNLLK